VDLARGYAKGGRAEIRGRGAGLWVKRNISARPDQHRRAATVLPASTSAEDILARNPDGVLLSNGPGDPAATGAYAVPESRNWWPAQAGVRHLPWPPDAGPGDGRAHGEDGPGPPRRNHPVKDLTTGKVEIVSMNHGFTVERASLRTRLKRPILAVRRHQRRLALKGRRCFSIQHHPEASPGPTDSLYLFRTHSAR